MYLYNSISVGVSGSSLLIETTQFIEIIQLSEWNTRNILTRSTKKNNLNLSNHHHNYNHYHLSCDKIHSHKMANTKIHVQRTFSTTMKNLTRNHSDFFSCLYISLIRIAAAGTIDTNFCDALQPHTDSTEAFT